MASTRINNDSGRIATRLEQSINAANWSVNVPGNGLSPSFVSDPFVRIQKWGANLRTNKTDVESELKGINRRLEKECLLNTYDKYYVQSQSISYPTCDILTTDQSRSSHPAWIVKDIESVPINLLFLQPQENCAFAFQNNIATRLLEKDFFNPSYRN